MTLTNAQIYTLRRMKTGTRYLMQGNGKKGMEPSRFYAVRLTGLGQELASTAVITEN